MYSVIGVDAGHFDGFQVVYSQCRNSSVSQFRGVEEGFFSAFLKAFPYVWKLFEGFQNTPDCVNLCCLYGINQFWTNLGVM